MTKPLASNGFGYSPEQASNVLVKVQAFFQLLPETLNVYQTQRRLVAQ